MRIVIVVVIHFCIMRHSVLFLFLEGGLVIYTPALKGISFSLIFFIWLRSQSLSLLGFILILLPYRIRTCLFIQHMFCALSSICLRRWGYFFHRQADHSCRPFLAPGPKRSGQYHAPSSEQNRTDQIRTYKELTLGDIRFDILAEMHIIQCWQ